MTAPFRSKPLRRVGWLQTPRSAAIESFRAVSEGVACPRGKLGLGGPMCPLIEPTGTMSSGGHHAPGDGFGHLDPVDRRGQDTPGIARALARGEQPLDTEALEVRPARYPHG